MNKMEALKRIEATDEAKESITVGIFPRELECDICHKHPKYLFRDVELGMDVCPTCSQLVDRIRQLPYEVFVKLI
jgi:uncharacterized protein (UPF0212 family)